jgi:hypothetical protein
MLAHCSLGMVFAINAPKEGEKTFEAFQKKALEFGKKEDQSSTQSSFAPTAIQAYAIGETKPPAPTPTEYEGAHHRVIVGANGTLTFYPPFVAAKPHDTIVSEPGICKKWPMLI